ncbi:MAG: terminase family protein [Kiritimatiellae bacterium]|nr:terminase family protein [Kiritimatiellia bacterium]
MRDALVQPATARQVAAFARQKGIEPNEAQERLEQLRAAQISRRRGDAFHFGYEPPIWFVVKALIRNPCWSDYERAHIRKRLGADWTAERFAEAMRRRLGFAHGVTKALVMGSNRSGKTDFAAKLSVQTLMLGGKKVVSGAQTHQTQKKNQMARVWNYMPEEIRRKNVATKKATSATENVSYTDKNGFAGSRVTLANGSTLDFVSYEQTTESQEGVECDLVHLDEEYPAGHYDLYSTRITSRAGVFLGTFTPLSGYTSAVAAFLNGSVTTMWHRAYLRPKDGGGREPWRELNLERSEYEKLTAWRRESQGGDCGVPESRPEDCFEWLFDKGDGRYPGPGPDGRAFDFTPRVAVCQGGEAAAVWFYGSDNPYGLPAELIATKMAGEGSDKRILASVYGVAQELKGRMFKKETIERNVVDAADVPCEDVVDFMVCDPSPERNWCFGWFRFHVPTGVLYMTREWPGNYEVPGQGVPGPWAVVSDRNDGLNDGARGEGQISFGWGYDQIFEEVARLEGGAEMAFRLLDSRAAAQSKISKTTNRLLIEDLEEYCDGWQVADGQRIEIGYTRMNDKFAAGKLKIAAGCVNKITCLKMLTGKDGQKGACKDMVDLVRYAVMSDVWEWRAGGAAGREERPEAGDDGLARKRVRRKSRVGW